jgi:hypothetical protein
LKNPFKIGDVVKVINVNEHSIAPGRIFDENRIDHWRALYLGIVKKIVNIDGLLCWLNGCEPAMDYRRLQKSGNGFIKALVKWKALQ